MFNARKKVLAIGLAAAMLVGTASTAFAVTDSATAGNKPVTQEKVLAKKKSTVRTTKSGNTALLRYYKTKNTTIKLYDKVTVKNVKYKLVRIAANAFSKNKSTVKAISMGTYVTTIEKNAFNGLKKLTTVTLRTNSKSKPRIKAGAFGTLDTKKITINVTGKISTKALKNLKKDLKTIKFKGTLKVAGKKVTF